MAGSANAARALLQGAIAEDPNDATAHFELARAHFYLGDFGAAQSQIERAAALAPRDARCHYWAGMAAMYNIILMATRGEPQSTVQEQAQKSIRAFEQALALRPRYDDARIGLIACRARLSEGLGGDRGKAEALVKEAERLGPLSYAKARSDLLDMKETDVQIKMWRDALAQAGESADAYEGLAAAYMRAKKLDEASDAIDKCMAIDPTRSALLLDLALHHAFTKRLDVAGQLIQQYLDTEPAPCVPMQACALCQLARVERLSGDRARAKELMERAKALDDRPWRAMRRPPTALFVAP